MKNVKIDIAKVEILEEVALSTAYAGVKSSSDSSLYDRVATIEDDEILLTRFWKQVCGEIMEKFQSLITASVVNDEKMSLNLELSSAYDESVTESMIVDIYSAIAAGITARWFRVAYPEKAEEWQLQSKDLLNRASSKLFYRQKPRRS